MRGMLKKVRLIPVIFMAAVLFAGCGKDDTKPSQGKLDLTSMTPRPTSETIGQAGNLNEISPELTNAPDAEIKPYEPITISFVGDVFTSDQMYQNYINAGGITGVVSEKVLEVFQGSDIMVANHEYCSTDIDDSNAADYQIWIEQCDTRNEFMFGELGIDVACIANNHMFDYGEQGFIDTLNGLTDMGITYVGGGMNYEDATEAKVMEVDDKSIAFFASNNVITRVDWIVEGDEPGMNGLYTWSETYTTMLENIKTASETHDFVVVQLHFGTEKENQHTEDQTAFAHACIDAGADVIIGHHAHVLQGIEYYGDGMIFYGLGNFLFSNYQSDTMVVTLTLERDNSFSAKILPCSSYLYYTNDVTNYTVFNLLNQYSVNAEVHEDGTVTRFE